MRRPKWIYDTLMKRNLTPWTRAMLDVAQIRAYVSVDESLNATDIRGGYIAAIIRDDEGVPACFKVSRTSELKAPYSYIGAVEVTFYEPWDGEMPNTEEYFDDDPDETYDDYDDYEDDEDEEVEAEDGK